MVLILVEEFVELGSSVEVPRVAPGDARSDCVLVRATHFLAFWLDLT